MPPTPSFFQPPPDRERADDLFADYLGFLEARNGRLEDGGWQTRAERVGALPGREVAFGGGFDGVAFNRNYEGLVDTDLTPEQLALLAFAKMNAGEAYGVEVMAVARAAQMARPEPIFQVEKVLGHEETFHTQILVGALQHVPGLEVVGAWRPAWPLKLLILALAKFPPSMFHPVLLGAEISGVFTLHWLLGRLGTLFPDDPQVRESMEQRILEVLVDEVGHVAYNRICVGAGGLSAARYLSRGVAQSHDQLTPELTVLGFDHARQSMDSFDYADLPEEVRRAAWFV